jgi:CheY-like chemotaxis protein
VDVLITDMDMPEMTGLELIEELQKQTLGHPTFSFLITASPAPGLKIAARHLNVREVLSKPVPVQRVCQIVSRALEEMN